jgi:hypothetical protein
MPCPQIDGNLVHGWLPFDALRARYCLRHGLPRPRSGGSQPPLLVEQGQPLAAAAAPPSERGRGQDRDTPRREAPKHGAPRNEGSLDAQAERRLPGTTVRVLAGDFARAPPLHPFFPVLPRSGPPHAAGVRSAVAALRYARSCQASQVNSAWGGSRAGCEGCGLGPSAASRLRAWHRPRTPRRCGSRRRDSGGRPRRTRGVGGQPMPSLR